MKLDRRFYSKNLVLVCFCLALCAKLLFMHYFFSFDTDRMNQALAAKSLVNGYGLSLPSVHSQNLSQVQYEPLVGWPYGYSLLLAPVYIVTKNLPLSCFFIEALGAFFFLLSYLLLLQRLKFPPIVISVLLLYNGFFLTDQIISANPTDLLALAFLISLCWYSLAFLQNPAFSFYKCLLLGLLCFLPALFRFMYLPLVIAVPILFLFIGWYKKRELLLKTGALVLGISIGLTMAMLFFHKLSTGYFLYPPTSYGAAIIPITKGVFWNNLLHFHPILISSLINSDFAIQLVSRLTGFSYVNSVQLCIYLNYALFLFFVGWMIKTYQSSQATIAPTWNLFLWISSTISFLTILLLSYLSVRNSSQFAPPFTMRWTYVQESRYFIFFMVCLPIYLSYYALYENKKSSIVIKRFIQSILIVAISFELAHGAYFIMKRVLPFNRYPVHEASEKAYLSFYKNFINSHQQRGIDVVTTSADPTLSAYGNYFNAKSLYQSLEITETLYAKRPTVVLLAVDKKSQKYYSHFFNKKGVRQIHAIDSTLFYTLYLNANEAR
jgi:hypothetical protein